MVEKMKYLNITGPKNDIDRVVNTYLNKYEIHLENAYAELGSIEDVTPFVEPNPYKAAINQAECLNKYLPKDSVMANRQMSSEEAIKIIADAYRQLEDYQEEKKGLAEEKERLSNLINEIEPFRMLNYNLPTIQHFSFIKYRFGKIPHQYYNKFSRYVYDTLNTIFYECNRDSDYVWGIYFVPSPSVDKVDAIFSSLHFERIQLKEDYEGTPEEAYQELLNKFKKVKEQIRSYKKDLMKRLESQSGDILLAKEILVQNQVSFDIRKSAVCTNNSSTGQVFYILCGWMGESDANAFLKETKHDPDVYCITQSVQDTSNRLKPPTKLKNPVFLKPFEMFVTMYGLPAYNEMDPTIFIALSYTFIFGIMFGDVGQGLCLAIGGFLLYKTKKMNLAGIISVAGCWSTFFGFMYGSIFGFEEILPAFWRRPMEDIMTTLMTAIVFGVVLIILAMVLNIINAIKIHDFEKAVFDPSGIAGLIVYVAAAASIGLAFTGQALPATIVLVLFIGLPLMAIFLKEPLNNLILKKGHIFPPGSKGMFFVEAFVELFDVVLSYATNTISFVRVGAFALSHAGMMGVVLSLANVESGSPNLLIIILGNILVTGLEGLVVGIQVLRLEYYEMFSRFYRGTGKEFKPFKAQNQ